MSEPEGSERRDVGDSVTRPIGDPSAPAMPPVPIDLSYRSRGSFLAAYATTLGKGGVFLETTAPLDVGTPVTLRLKAPEVPEVDVDGVITWTRPTATGVGQPAGMGVAIAGPAEALGHAVDEVAFGFGRMKVLLVAGEAAPRAILSRYLRSILRCEIVDSDTGGGGAALVPDLAVIDLDSSGQQGLDLYSRLRGRPETQSLPVLALAHIERDRTHALRSGFDEAQPNPPVFADLQGAVLRCLARPVSCPLRVRFEENR